MRTALQTRVSQTLHDERQSPSLEQPPRATTRPSPGRASKLQENEIVENKQLLHSLTIFEA